MTITKKCPYCDTRNGSNLIFCEFCGNFLNHISEMPNIKYVKRKQFIILELFVSFSILIFFLNLFLVYLVIVLVSLIRCDRREYWDVLFASQMACLAGICFSVEVFFKVIKLKERTPIKLEKNHLRIKQFALTGVISNSLILATYTIMLLILFLVC